jgi:lactoylglutathione lyase
MNFRYTILYVQDVEATLALFGRAFGFETAFVHESKDYGELDTGATKLAFSSIALMQQLGKSPATGVVANPSFEIAFETDDVTAALKRATGAGAELVQDVEVMPWGQTTAYVKLPEGFLIEICTPVQSAVQTP